MKTIVFIINPISGGRKKRKVERSIDRFFGNQEFSFKKYFTSFPGHASEIARKEMDNHIDIFVVVGGDGTINEVASVLINTECRMGIIPMGSGNGFARHFGIPLNIDKAVRRIKQGNEICIDAGVVNEKPFFCTTGIGFDAETDFVFSQLGSRGFLTYAFSFFSVLRKYVAKNYLIELGDEIIQTEAFFINIANISQLGYHFFIAPGASATDGTLDLVIVKKFPKWKAFMLALSSFAGRIDKSRYVTRRKITTAKIKTADNHSKFHIDGDPNIEEGNEFNYNILPGSLKVIV